jgi:RNA polymerase sigma-70 factor, ECF subfamily
LFPGDGLARCGCHSQGAASRAAQPVEFEDFRVALAMLPSGQREAQLLGASGFSYYEAAAICESAVGTIKNRVNRARKRLSKLLSIDSADRFGQDHTTRAVLTAGGHG